MQKIFTSNNASANTKIRAILARVLDTSVINNVQEHVPSWWRPDGQEDACPSLLLDPE